MHVDASAHHGIERVFLRQCAVMGLLCFRLPAEIAFSEGLGSSRLSGIGFHGGANAQVYVTGSASTHNERKGC